MKLPLFALLCALSVSACAQTKPADADKAAGSDGGKASGAAAASAGSPDEAKIRAALKGLNPKLVPEHIGPAPIPGYQEVIFSGNVIYVSNDGRYLVQGLMDLESKEDLSQSGALPSLRRVELKKIPVTDRIVFAPVGARKHTVTVFTDIECGYCRKMHSEVGEYNKLGIAFEYVAFPRAGIGSPDALAMESVWCSADRRKALTDAKNGLPVPPKRCDNPVEAQHDIGQRIGLQGTPMVINADGVALPGYLPPAKMLEALDKLAAKAKTETVAAGSP
ncbi:MAG: thioredoxin fold domain-containing protein [Pseudomonadota bacterium]